MNYALFLLALCFSTLSFSIEDEDYTALKILTKNCASCHQTKDHPGAKFLNEAELTQPETLKLIRRLIDTSQMPPEHVTFKKSKDGKALLKWLKKKEAAKEKK